MYNHYAFSFDRESFRGEYATREQAIEAGMRAVVDHQGPIEAVFVGKRVAVDPLATDHAEVITKSMRQRMQSKTGQAGYLAGVNEHLLADLDEKIARVIIDWLRRHQLEPAEKITSISEHALPNVRAHAPATSRKGEIGPMGGEE